ncbi:MAG TPA: hypothetical protein VGH19_07685 [Verrucomicrobiae bacterium]
MSQTLSTFGNEFIQAVIMVNTFNVFMLVAGLGLLSFLLVKKQRVFASVWFVILSVLMAGLTMPVFSRSAKATTRINCTSTRVQVEMAIQHWVEEGKIVQGADVDLQLVAAYLKGGVPKCPEGGAYLVGKVGQHVSCTIADHNRN